MEIQKTHKRKSGSQFDQIVNYINSLEPGTVYTSKQLRSKCFNVNSERLCYIHIGLMKMECVKRVAVGYYKVLGFIPEFVTNDLLEGSRGYYKQILNPEYKGNGNGQYLSVPRGAKWKLGQPSPYTMESPYNKVQVNPYQDKVEEYKQLLSNSKNNDTIRAELNSGSIVEVKGLSDNEQHIICYYEDKNIEYVHNLGIVRNFYIVSTKPKEEPVKKFSTQELISKKQYILNVIEECNKKIFRQGGWIGRESNWESIENAKSDLAIIEAELKLREKQAKFSKESIVNILNKGLSIDEAATLIMNLTKN